MRRSPWPGPDGRQLTLGLALTLGIATLLVAMTAAPIAVSAGEWFARTAVVEWDAEIQLAGAASPASPTAGRRSDRPAASASRSATTSVSASPSASRSPEPSAPSAPALATDTVSLFGFVCDDAEGASRVVYSRNPSLADPTGSCRPAGSGELTLIVTDPADLTVRYDRVQTGPDGYANAVVPVGRPFVLVLAAEGEPVTRAGMSPVYRLNARPDQRQPISIRVFQISGVPDSGTGTGTGTPIASDRPATAAGTPGAASAAAQPITIQGMICVSESRAGIYDYLPGADQPALSDEQCRRATVDEMEFLLLDNDNPSTLYDDETTGIDGVAVADAPIDQPFFVTEFSDDPGVETGLPGGSSAITIPRDPAGRQPVVLTVVRNVAPGALDLPAGTMLLSTVVCPPAAEPESLTVLGPAPTVLIRPEGVPPGTPQPGSGVGCEEATGQYEIAPYGDETVAPVEVDDGADDGALIVPLPATLTVDGARVFDPYRITETSSGQTVTFDVQEGAYTSLRVVLVDQPATPATPVANDATAIGLDAATPGPGLAGADDAPPDLPGTPGVTGGPAATVPATAATAAPDETGSGGMSYSPVRLLWAALAVLAIGIFLVGAWVLRRPGHRWRRRAGS